MAYDLGLKKKTIGGQVNIFDSGLIRWIRGAVTIDSAKVKADTDGRKTLKLGEFLAKLAGGKYAPTKHTYLAAAAASTDTVIKVDDASRFQAGDTIDINGTTATIAANGVNTGVTPHEITLIAAIGAAKATDDPVKATDGGTFDLMLGEDIDCTDGDVVTTAFDQARVIDSRLPRQATAQAKAELKGITFV